MIKVGGGVYWAEWGMTYDRRTHASILTRVRMHAYTHMHIHACHAHAAGGIQGSPAPLTPNPLPLTPNPQPVPPLAGGLEESDMAGRDPMDLWDAWFKAAAASKVCGTPGSKPGSKRL